MGPTCANARTEIARADQGTLELRRSCLVRELLGRLVPAELSLGVRGDLMEGRVGG